MASWIEDLAGIKRAQADGTDLPRRGKLNFINATLSDNPTDDSTDIVLATPDAIGTAILTSALPAGVDEQIIVASGRDTFGDGGGGLLVFDASSTATPDDATVWQVGVLPGRWERVFDGRSFDVRWFGAKTTLTPASSGALITANTAAIQACIDAAIAVKAGRVLAPSGRYVINSTLHMGLETGFSTVVMEGDGYRYSAYDDDIISGCGTAFVAIHTDSPAINIQGGRGSAVLGVATLGALEGWVDDHDLGQQTGAIGIDDTLPASWVDTTHAASGDTRYAPYAGITIDGWSGTAPATAYPTTFREYGGSFSSDVLIDNCYISGFNTAIANQPCDADGNGDFTLVRRTFWARCKWGLSVGNSQSRQLGVQDCKSAFVYCNFTNKVHGKQIGKFSGTIDNFSYGACIMLHDFNSSSNFGPLKYVSCYGETIWRIGDISASSADETAVEYDHCQFAFNAQVEARGIPATVLGGASNQISINFRGCSFTSYPSVLVFDQIGVTFDSCQNFPSSRNSSPISKAYLATFHNATCGGLIFKNLRTDECNRITFKPVVISTLNLTTTTSAHQRTRAFDRTTCTPAWIPSMCAKSDSTASRVDIIKGAYSLALNGSAFDSVDLLQDATERGKLTLVFNPGFLDDWVSEMNGIAVGDCIYHDTTGMTFAIRSRSGLTVIAEAQNNYKLSGGVYTTSTAAFNNTDGNFYFLNCRIYTPDHPAIVTLTSGSDVLTAAGSDVGTATNLMPDMAVGDRILTETILDHWVSPAVSKILAIDETAKTITLDGLATRTVARKRITCVVRAPEANSTTR